MQPKEFDSSVYRAAFDAAVVRIEAIKGRSPICVKALPILRGLQWVTYLFGCSSLLVFVGGVLE
jgi:hypothetical protein